eukprot:TRINITY_DN1045_c0_g1_i1.p1 TRINITY_DN1045_c0_g1~~TRINITY_DN1045_c0_g1_i1.p1  ORF type:complete len:208 (-),score=10.58 TRINITY_DN1045_c0_g1_i1:411-1034(-)
MVVEQSEITIADDDRRIPQNLVQSRPRRDCFLAFCKLVNVVTGLCGLLCLVAYCMALSEDGPLTQASAVKPQILRLYGVLFSFIIVLIETEWQWFISFFRLVEVWIFRGILYIYFAVLTLYLAMPSYGGSKRMTDFDKSLRLYRSIAGYALLACGGFYLIGGALCFQVLKRHRHRRVRERDRVLKDLEDLDRQREELIRLHSVYSAE